MKKLMSVIISVFLIAALLVPQISMSACAFSIEIDNGGYINSQLAYESTLLDSELENYQTLKNYLREKFINCETEIPVSSFGISASDLTALRACIFYDIPEAFHVDSFAYYRNSSTNLVTKLVMYYNMTKEEYQAQLDVCECTAEVFISDLKNSSLSEAYKALLVHDRLIEWCEYDYQSLLDNNVPDSSYKINGVFVNGIAVCAGYSRAYKYMLEKLGMTCFMCDSDELNHDWNIVVIDGERYHVDTTWDDPVWDIYGRVLHKNFLRSTDGIIATDHTASDFDTSPVSTTYDSYYWQNSETEFQYKNGVLYYFDNINKNLNKIENGTTITLKAVSDRWNVSGGYYSKSFVRLDSDNHGNYLFYSTPSAIYKYDLDTNTVSEFYTPNLPGNYYWIYGFKAQNNYFYLNIYNNPNLTAAAYSNNIVYQYFDRFILSDNAPYLYDAEKQVLYGNGIMSADLYSLLSCFENTNIVLDFSGYDKVTSSTKFYLVDDEMQVYDTAYVAVIGDVNGDGWYDGTDSVLVNCLVHGILTKAQVGEAAYFAADCDRDGTVSAEDVAILEQAGLLLSEIDINKTPAELSEDAAFSEYLNLIEANVKHEMAEKTEDTAEIITEEPESHNIFIQIIEFMFKIITALRSLFFIK